MKGHPHGPFKDMPSDSRKVSARRECLNPLCSRQVDIKFDAIGWPNMNCSRKHGGCGAEIKARDRDSARWILTGVKQFWQDCETYVKAGFETFNEPDKAPKEPAGDGFVEAAKPKQKKADKKAAKAVTETATGQAPGKSPEPEQTDDDEDDFLKELTQ